MSREHKKLERLMLFAEVAKQLSFSKAAETLSISRGYLSDQIKRLESELSAPLFIRSTRKIRLTEDGEKILAEVEKIKRTMIEMERNLKQDREAVSGLLKITAPKLFTQYFLLDLCGDFQQQHPNIRFEIDCSYTKHDLILSHYDLAFRATNTPPQNMIAKPMFSYSHCCCASPEYLNRAGRPTTIQDLQQHQCLYGPGDGCWHFDSDSVEVEGWFSVNDHQMLKQQALAGRGIIKVSEYVVNKEIELGQLEKVLEQKEAPRHTIYLVHPQTILQNARLRAFIGFTGQWIAPDSTK